MKYVNGYDAIDILAGQGTIGLEVLEQVEGVDSQEVDLTKLQVPNVEAIIVPIGGGGMVAGIAVAAKTLKPEIMIIVGDFCR